MNRPSYLSVEVWIGPMEGLRHVEKAGDRARGVVYIGRQAANKKRGVENHLVLLHEPGVSGSQAELRFDDGRLYLRDLGSTNGTYVREQRIADEVEVFSGEIIVAGFTPLRVELLEDPEVALPPNRLISDDSWAGAALEKAFRGARAVAQRRGEGFIDTRHLCDSLLKLQLDPIEKALKDAHVPREDALSQLWDGGLLPSSNAWLKGILQRTQKPSSSGEFLASPKVVGCVDSTLRLQHSLHGEVEQAGELFRCLLADRSGPVGVWLRGRGIRLEPLAASAPARGASLTQTGHSKTARLRVRAIEREAARTEMARPVEKVVLAPPSRPSRPAAKAAPRDAGVDQQARELADELAHLAAAYRFSTAADRRSVLKGRISKEMNRVAPEKRGSIVEQLRAQFPVSGAPPVEADEEVVRLRRRVRELEAQLERPVKERAAPPAPAAAPAPASPRASSAPFAWRELAERTGEASGPGVATLRELLNFAVNLERFVLGLVESTTMPGSTTTSFHLPNFSQNIEGVLLALKEGREPDVEKLKSYLGDLQRWQVAIQAAHYEAPRLWFAKLWKRIAPSAIEAATREGGWKLRGEAVDWWNLYRQVVKDLSPELVQDQILHMVSEVAQEEHAKMKRGSRNNE